MKLTTFLATAFCVFSLSFPSLAQGNVARTVSFQHVPIPSCPPECTGPLRRGSSVQKRICTRLECPLDDTN
ncbi:hypothetical protein B0H19DRAFT_1129876 [Mycena capillaripes]|nr:hypothetical protein B0H19DRAFT_1129876 [Mycena capillaripes]